jgi:hypothetical protein
MPAKPSLLFARAPATTSTSKTSTAPALRGLAHEVEFACKLDAFPVIPALQQDRLRLVA